MLMYTWELFLENITDCLHPMRTHTGHWIGMDVHDVSSVSHERPLVPGVALTVEPGLYIPDLPEYGPFAGIGVRVEDDVVVTEEGCEVLSGSLPVAADQVEVLCGY